MEALTVTLTEPWELLDLDDSDLPSPIPPSKRKAPNPVNSILKGPSLQRCSTLSRAHLQPSPLIPGPAGAVQAAMFRRSQGMLCGDPIPTQEYIRKAVEEPGGEDDDFSRDPWLFAVDYVRRKGSVGGDRVAIGTPLSLIRFGSVQGKVGQIVAIVKSCTPNGLGDVMVTLKDPTGSIDGSLHRRVFTEGEFGKEISVGAVLILQKVAIFSSSRATFYLNITHDNLVKAFSKGCRDLEPIEPVSTIQLPLPSVEHGEVLTTQQCSLSQRGNDGIIENIRQSANIRESMRHDKELEDEFTLGSSLCKDGSNQNHSGLVEKVLPSSVTKKVEGFKRARSDISYNKGHTEEVVVPKQRTKQNQEDEVGKLGSTNSRNAEANSVGLDDNTRRRSESTRGSKENLESLAPKGTLPLWTEEQLDELLAFD